MLEKGQRIHHHIFGLFVSLGNTDKDIEVHFTRWEEFKISHNEEINLTGQACEHFFCSLTKFTKNQMLH